MTAQDNVRVFWNTVKMCSTKYYKECRVMRENTMFYPDPTLYPAVNTEARSNVVFKKSGSMSAAYDATFNKGRVAVLDFADARKPGGYPEYGAFTQEENMCRCSTLFQALVSHPEYYEYNSLFDAAYSNGALYVPGVTMFKDDETYEGIPDRWFDVIVCPAPNRPVSASVIDARAFGIIKLAAYRKVDVLILGAWGCGAFEQSPDVVGRAFARALNICNPFREVIFAIRATDGDWGSDNYEAVYNSFTAEYASDVG